MLDQNATTPQLPAEDDSVTQMLTAYTKSFAKALREASAAERVFLIITAPVERGGRVHVAGNLAEKDYAPFLRMVLASSTGDVPPAATFNFKTED